MRLPLFALEVRTDLMRCQANEAESHGSPHRSLGPATPDPPTGLRSECKCKDINFLGIT